MSIKEIGAVELAALVKEKSIKVIDVRSISEIIMGTVAGAKPIPLHTIPLRYVELNKDEKIALICRSGARSAQATMFLQDQGFKNVFNLTGGMISWAQHGLEVSACTECN